MSTIADSRMAGLRGFVEQRPDGLWYAHCIDLTLDALANDRQRAIDELVEVMEGYSRWVLERGDVKLRRRSPLSFQLRYWRARLFAS